MSDQWVSRTPIDQAARELTEAMKPLDGRFSYATTSPIAEDDLREFLHEPIGALPPSVCEAIAPVRIVLAPFLDRADGMPSIVFSQPAEDTRLRSAYLFDGYSTLFFATRDGSTSDYHQSFFNTLAHLISRRLDRERQSGYAELLQTELEQNVSGEVDEASWERKQDLVRRSGERLNVRSKVFREYAVQSFADTMTLYLHGICCDIDVEKGPRQLPSRWLRKRLEALYKVFPPPDGRPVLPEHVSRSRH